MQQYKFVFCVLIVIYTSFSSDSLDTIHSFVPADYHPPQFRVQSLSISPDISFQANGQKDSSSGFDNISNTNSFSQGMSLHGSHSIRKFSVLSDIDISTGASFYGTGFDNQERSSSTRYAHSTVDPRFSCSLNNATRYRRYLPFGLFIEGAVSPIISNSQHTKSERQNYEISYYEYDSLKNRLSNYSINKNVSQGNSVSIGSALNVSLGKGWIADVTGAAVALQMIDRINALNGSQPKLLNTQIGSLSRLLDHFRRKRVFDSRIAEIEAVDTLCQYLVTENILPKETARMTMEMNDIYAYGFNQPRYSGKEIKLSPIAHIDYSRNISTSSYNYQDSIGPYDPAIRPQDLASWPLSTSTHVDSYYSKLFLSYGLSASGNISRLYGRDFEVDGEINLSGVMNILRDSSYSTSENTSYRKKIYPNAHLNISLNFKWYPSMRSTISILNQFNYNRDFNFRSLVLRNYSATNIDLSPGIFAASDYSSTLDARYYISPCCSYTVWTRIQYTKGRTRESNGFNFQDLKTIQSFDLSIGARLTYAFF